MLSSGPIITEAHDLQMHQVDPQCVEASLVCENLTVLPWEFLHLKVGSTINNPVSFRAILFEKDAFLAAFEHTVLGKEGAITLWEFMSGCWTIPKDATKGDFFEFLNHIGLYCKGMTIYILPTHVCIQESPYGLW